MERPTSCLKERRASRKPGLYNEASTCTSAAASTTAFPSSPILVLSSPSPSPRLPSAFSYHSVPSSPLLRHSRNISAVPAMAALTAATTTTVHSDGPSDVEVSSSSTPTTPTRRPPAGSRQPSRSERMLRATLERDRSVSSSTRRAVSPSHHSHHSRSASSSAATPNDPFTSTGATQQARCEFPPFEFAASVSSVSPTTAKTRSSRRPSSSGATPQSPTTSTITVRQQSPVTRNINGGTLRVPHSHIIQPPTFNRRASAPITPQTLSRHASTSSTSSVSEAPQIQAQASHIYRHHTDMRNVTPTPKTPTPIRRPGTPNSLRRSDSKDAKHLAWVREALTGECDSSCDVVKPPTTRGRSNSPSPHSRSRSHSSRSHSHSHSTTASSSDDESFPDSFSNQDSDSEDEDGPAIPIPLHFNFAPGTRIVSNGNRKVVVVPASREGTPRPSRVVTQQQQEQGFLTPPPSPQHTSQLASPIQMPNQLTAGLPETPVSIHAPGIPTTTSPSSLHARSRSLGSGIYSSSNQYGGVGGDGYSPSNRFFLANPHNSSSPRRPISDPLPASSSSPPHSRGSHQSQSHCQRQFDAQQTYSQIRSKEGYVSFADVQGLGRALNDGDSADEADVSERSGGEGGVRGRRGVRSWVLDTIWGR